MEQTALNSVSGSTQECVLLREHAAAQLLDHSVATLRKWRVTGGGPNFVKISRRSVRYKYSDIIQWIERHTVQNTSQVPS